jgi:hypothetical protein
VGASDQQVAASDPLEGAWLLTGALEGHLVAWASGLPDGRSPLGAQRGDDNSRLSLLSAHLILQHEQMRTVAKPYAVDFSVGPLTKD